MNYNIKINVFVYLDCVCGIKKASAVVTANFVQFHNRSLLFQTTSAADVTVLYSGRQYCWRKKQQLL